METAQLSKINSGPTAPDHVQRFFPNCCLSLSTAILAVISKHLPTETGRVLSIGSGSGFLEYHLQKMNSHLTIEGVEVKSTNLYLEEENINIVKGTWDVCSRAVGAVAWMFVYPRSPRLVSTYLTEFGSSETVQKIIWIGPSEDWNEFSECFQKSSFVLPTDSICLSRSEILAVLVRKATL